MNSNHTEKGAFESSKYIPICKKSDINSGTVRTFTVAGKKIAVAHVDGNFFAVDDTCTHEQCSLGEEGDLDGTIIVCGCHGASFDITNGQVLSLPAPTSLLSYELMVGGNDIYIKLGKG